MSILVTPLPSPHCTKITKLKIILCKIWHYFCHICSLTAYIVTPVNTMAYQLHLAVKLCSMWMLYWQMGKFPHNMKMRRSRKKGKIWWGISPPSPLPPCDCDMWAGQGPRPHTMWANMSNWVTPWTASQDIWTAPKCLVWADTSPTSCGQRPPFIFFWDPSLREGLKKSLKLQTPSEILRPPTATSDIFWNFLNCIF